MNIETDDPRRPFAIANDHFRELQANEIESVLKSVLVGRESS